MKISTYILAARKATIKAWDAADYLEATHSQEARERFNAIVMRKGAQATRLFDYATKLGDRLQREAKP